MSHDITIRRDGRAEAAYALTPAWHGLGTVVDHAMNSEEAIEHGGLGWLVRQCPVFARIASPETSTHTDSKVDHMWANVRDDNNEVLGLVSNQYQVVQNREAFGFVDQLLMDGIVKYESVGSLRGGKIVWLFAKMPEEFQIAAGDASRRYVLFSNTHDGSASVRCLATNVRVVCWNTYTLATNENNPYGITIRHKGDLQGKLAAARDAMKGVQQAFNDFDDKSRRLLDRKVDEGKLEAYLNVLIPDEEGVNCAYRAMLRTQIANAFHEGPQMLPSIRGTAWAAWNAVTQVVDHNSIYRARTGSRAENRMISTMFGANARLKRSAFALAVGVFT